MSRVSKDYWSQEWDVKTLDEICTLQIGRTPRRSNQDYWRNGTHTWVTIADMDSRSISSSKEQVSDKAIEDNKVVLVPKGSLLMSFKLTIGKLAFAEKDLFTNEAIVALNIKPKFQEEIEPDYLYWVLQAVPLEKESIFAVKGRTLNTEKLKRIEMPIPERDVQRRIVARIEALLAEVREMRKLHDEITNQTNSLMQAVLAEQYSEFLEKYETVETQDVCLSITDGSHTTPPYVQSGVPFLFVKHIVNRFLDFQDTKFVTQSYYDGLSDTRKPEKGDVLLSVVGSYGVPVVVDTDDDFCFQRHIAILKPDPQKIKPQYLRWMLDAPQVLDQMHKVVTGSAQKTLTLTYLRKLSFPCPTSISQQEQVATTLNKIFEEISEMQYLHKEDAIRISQLEQAVLAQAFRGDL